MTAVHSRSLRATAFGRRLRITIAALVLSALCLGSGATASQAATGSVYYDSYDNVGAGAATFNSGPTPGTCCNVGVGFYVFPSLVSGANNTAIGEATLRDNSSGSRNTASGSTALLNNESGSDNVAIGDQALLVSTTGANNVGNGSQALKNATGSSNIALGSGAGLNLTTGSNNIDIGNVGKAGESKAIRIGTKGDQVHTFIAGISGRTVNGTAQPVVVNAQGQLGTASAAAPATASAVDPLSAADGERLLDLVQRQQREIDRLREQVKGG